MQPVGTSAGPRRPRRGPVEEPGPEPLPRKDPERDDPPVEPPSEPPPIIDPDRPEDETDPSRAPVREPPRRRAQFRRGPRRLAASLHVLALASLSVAGTGCPTRAELTRELEMTRKTLEHLDASLARSDRIRAALADDRSRLVGENLSYRDRIVGLERRLLDAVVSRRVSSDVLDRTLPVDHPWLRERDQLRDVRRQLAPLVAAGIVAVERRGSKLVIALPGAALFRSGTTRLLPEGKATLDRIVPALSILGDHTILVGGRHEGRPVHSARFRDSREFGAARALAVIQHLVGGGIRSSRLAAAGFAAGGAPTGKGQRTGDRLELLIEPVVPLRSPCHEPAVPSDVAVLHDSTGVGRPPVDGDSARRRKGR